MCQTCSKLIEKKPENDFIVNFEQTSWDLLVRFMLLTLARIYMSQVKYEFHIQWRLYFAKDK